MIRDIKLSSPKISGETLNKIWGKVSEGFLALMQERIDNIIKENGLTYAELAEKMDMDRSNLRRMVTGQNLTVLNLYKLSLVLGCDITEFLYTPKRKVKKQH